MKTAILNASVDFVEQPFLKPLQLSSGLITSVTEARVETRVLVDGKEAVGYGSIYLSDLWAWPEAGMDRSLKDAAMRRFCEEIAASLSKWCGGEAAHPLELGLRLHHAISATDVCPEIPLLGKAVCASPFDAAIHDATGRALGISAFDFYKENEAIPSADGWFPGSCACESIREVFRDPSSVLDAWWVVGARDDLENNVRPLIAKNQIKCFKIKVLGKDNAADAARTVEIYRAAKGWGIAPILSIDSNEANPDAASVLEYLSLVEKLDADAYAALSYLEQPTARDIVAHPFDWHEVAKRKPIFLDEGLTKLELLPVAQEQGWSGLALKTCKGHSFVLVAAAWARRNGLQLALQDLTNPGYAAVHSFLLGAYIPTVNGIELNSPQYTPAANADWLPALSGLFEPCGGVHRLEVSAVPGLGSSLKNL